MLSQRQLFLRHQAQTSSAPMGLEIERASGIYLYDNSGKSYMDMISGIAVSNVGHCHPKVVKAIEDQAAKYMHLMVYGEYIQSPQVKLAEALTALLPPALQSVYFVNSGSEAIEGAVKLAKRYTGRTELIAFKNAYHGSTHGSLSLMGNEYFKQAYRPLLPDIQHLDFNAADQLHEITERSACVVVEPIQGEAGVVLPTGHFLKQLRERCTETGTLLLFDEIQCGFGRTGSLFAFEQFGVIPDILCLAKGMGGGLPIGAFISSMEIMNSLSNNPVLGHITTFGGNAVCCAASMACLTIIVEEKLAAQALQKEKLFRKLLLHSRIVELSGKGLFLALRFASKEENMQAIQHCLEQGIITDWFLFDDCSMRLAPPLTITEPEIEQACAKILTALDAL